MKQLKAAGLVALLCILCLPLIAAPSRLLQPSANQPASKIMGTLLDVNDARVAHAKIKVESAKFKWEGESDEAGDFTADVPVDTYRIYVEANGFRKFESPFLKAKSRITELVNIHLEVLTIIDTIEVKEKNQP